MKANFSYVMVFLICLFVIQTISEPYISDLNYIEITENSEEISSIVKKDPLFETKKQVFLDGEHLILISKNFYFIQNEIAHHQFVEEVTVPPPRN